MHRIALIALTLAFSSCDQPTRPSANKVIQEAGIDTVFNIQQGSKVTHLKLAGTDLEKSRGLMGVEKLPADTGMIFMYEADQVMRFWMKDTLLDLDIAFVQADGVIAEIRTMKAEDLTEVSSQSSHIRFCIEMPAGWYASSKIKTGDTVNLTQLREALTARGFNAQRYFSATSERAPNRQ
ncbi:MAG: DUF192 domain-containing protein [Opitutae bacterium]